MKLVGRVDAYRSRPRRTTIRCAQIILFSGIACGWSIVADTLYIHDMLYVPLRSEPQAAAEAVTKSLASGTPLERLQQRDETDYVLVRYLDPNGEATDGYIHQQYLTKTPVAAAQFEAASKENEALKAQVGQLENDYSTLDQALASLSLKQEETKEALSLAQAEAERMRQLSQSASQLDADRMRLEQQNALLVEEITSLRNLESKTQAEIQQRWYLIGATSAFAMALIGFLVGRRIYHRRYAGGWS